MSEIIATVAVPEFDQRMYDINADAPVSVTVTGYVLHHYQPRPTQTFKSDEELANSGVELKVKLCDGHWLIAFPEIKRGA